MLIASLASTAIALIFNVESAITAGILAILSIKLTKSDSIDLAFRRFIDALLALLLSTLLFMVLGYSMAVFFVFTILFIIASFLLKIDEGIVPSLVLANILLQHGSFDVATLINTFALIAIAITVALFTEYLLSSQLTKRTETVHKRYRRFNQRRHQAT